MDLFPLLIENKKKNLRLCNGGILTDIGSVFEYKRSVFLYIRW
jgi:hypothetical protein